MEKIRLKIQEILNGKDIITVNRESNIHLSGVYMLYEYCHQIVPALPFLDPILP